MVLTINLTLVYRFHFGLWVTVFGSFCGFFVRFPIPASMYDFPFSICTFLLDISYLLNIGYKCKRFSVRLVVSATVLFMDSIQFTVV